MINLKISPQAKRVHLPEVVGKGYGTFWNFKGRYRVCKGSRASKKSKTTALNIIKRMMQYPEANTLVVRKVFRTLKDSCFTELKWAINRLGVSAYWEIKESPLEMTYLPTGQKIYFRGLDDPLKVTSITVEIGYLCWCWIEEAYEIMNEADFDMLDESIRGAIPEETGLFKQITLTFNPWNESIGSGNASSERSPARMPKGTPHTSSMIAGSARMGRFTPQPPITCVMNGWMRRI